MGKYDHLEKSYGGQEPDTIEEKLLRVEIVKANELAESNRLTKIQIVWGGRAGNMTDESKKKLIDILKDSENDNLDIYGDFGE